MGQLCLTCHALPMDVDSSFGMMSFPLVCSVADVLGCFVVGLAAISGDFGSFVSCSLGLRLPCLRVFSSIHPMLKADCSCPVKMAACHELESSGYYHAPPLSRLQP